MATRTVRLDTEAEKALQEVQAATGLPSASRSERRARADGSLSHARTRKRGIRSLEGIRADGRAVGVGVRPPTLARAFELMDVDSDHPMDLADAALVVASESLGTRKVFTVDRKDFEAYRVRRGHRPDALEIVP